MNLIKQPMMNNKYVKSKTEKFHIKLIVKTKINTTKNTTRILLALSFVSTKISLSRTIPL